MALTLHNLGEIAKQITFNLKKEKKLRLKELNPDLHFRKLLESHSIYNMDDDSSNFFAHIIDEEWFNNDNMPSTWSYKTWSEAIRSLIYLFQNSQVKPYIIEKLDINKYNKIINHCEGKRKYFMTLYRKKRQDSDKPDISFTPGPSSLESESGESALTLNLGGTPEAANSIESYNELPKLVNIELIKTVETQICRIIGSRADDALLGASLYNVLDILKMVT